VKQPQTEAGIPRLSDSQRCRSTCGRVRAQEAVRADRAPLPSPSNLTSLRN
jgi:hypothetical protein